MLFFENDCFFFNDGKLKKANQKKFLILFDAQSLGGDVFNNKNTMLEWRHVFFPMTDYLDHTDEACSILIFGQRKKRKPKTG